MKAGVCLGVPTLLLKDTPLLHPPPFRINTTRRFAWASLAGNTCNLEGLETLQEYEAIQTSALVFSSQMEVLVWEFLHNATLERWQKAPSVLKHSGFCYVSLCSQGFSAPLFLLVLTVSSIVWFGVLFSVLQ